MRQRNTNAFNAFNAHKEILMHLKENAYFEAHFKYLKPLRKRE